MAQETLGIPSSNLDEQNIDSTMKLPGGFEQRTPGLKKLHSNNLVDSLNGKRFFHFHFIMQL